MPLSKDNVIGSQEMSPEIRNLVSKSSRHPQKCVSVTWFRAHLATLSLFSAS